MSRYLPIMRNDDRKYSAMQLQPGEGNLRADKKMMRSLKPIVGHNQLVAGLFLVLAGQSVWALEAIVTDGSMGAVKTLKGAQVMIPQNIGTTMGGNLFHSFKSFNINSGQTVVFSGSGQISHVISRVTGNRPSVINGTLKSNIANAAFYFINPHGVTFGADAQIDVPSDFHVSTADKIDFGNGHLVFAELDQPSTLSSAAPRAFGFLATSSHNNGLISVKGAQLAVREGQTQDIVAGKIVIDDNSHLVAPAGEIRLLALNGKSEASLAVNDAGYLSLPVRTPDPSQAGEITIRSPALSNPWLGNLDTSGAGGGRMVLWGSDIRFVNSTAYADNNTDTAGGTGAGIGIRAHSMTVDNSWLTTDALAAGSAAGITIAVDDYLAIKNLSTVKSFALKDGNAGPLALRANTLDITNGGYVVSSTYGSGHSGDIAVVAEQLSIDNQGNKNFATGIGTAANPDSSGRAGDVVVTVKQLELLRGGQISSATYAQGSVGNVTVNADTLTLASLETTGQVTSISSNVEQGGSGQGGRVSIQTSQLTLTGNSEIASVTNGLGNAGHINIKTHTMRVDGQGNSANAAAGVYSTANQQSTGRGGNIDITSSNLQIVNGGNISSSTNAQGVGGNITISADTLRIDSQGYGGGVTGVNSQANIGTGDAGQIKIRTGELAVIGGALATSTFDQGAAGLIDVKANHLLVDGRYPSQRSGIFSEALTTSEGVAGRINLDVTDTIRLRNGGRISIANAGISQAAIAKPQADLRIDAKTLDLDASRIGSFSTGNIAAANITLRVAKALSLHSSYIDTSANTGNGGDITITGNCELIDFDNGGLMTSVARGSQRGGNINATAQLLLMNSAVIQANADAGQGGDVTLALQSLLPANSTLRQGGRPVTWRPEIRQTNLIQAASNARLDGQLNVTEPQLNLSGIIANLGQPYFENPIVGQDFCRVGESSSLTATGAGGLRPTAADLLF